MRGDGVRDGGGRDGVGGAEAAPSRRGGLPRGRRDGFEPAYARIVRTISERIARGQYRPGDQLPSESQFCAEFEVSPMTLRRAVNMLVDRGLVVTAQGRGTFVKALDFGEASFGLRELTDRWREAASEVRLLEAAVLPADETVAGVLGLPPGSPTVALRRLYLDGGRPLVYHSEHLVYDPRRPLVESQLQATTMDGILDPVGGEAFARARLSLSAECLEGEEAGWLERPVGTAAFRVEYVFDDFDGSPASWGRLHLPADRFRLTTELGAAL